MTCPCCNDALEWPGTVAARTYTPACLWCGARYIRLLPKQGGIDGRPLTNPEVVEWRRKVLADWIAHGHPEAELRALAKGEALPLAPESSEQPRKRGG